MTDTTPLESGSNWDVVIVGSGLSGLTAATRILQANKERKVLIVDAVDWFGGRTRSIELTKYDSKVSIGGTFALFEHNDTLQLAKEVNCSPTETLKISDVNFNQFSKALFDPSGLPLFFKLMYKGAKIVKEGKIDWACKTAKELEKISLEDWISKHWILNKFNPNFTREFFYLLETFPNLHGVSALVCAIALYVRFRGIPRNGIEIPPKVLRWEGGTGVFTQALVENLSRNENFRLNLNSPVEQIIQPAINSGANAGPYPVQVIVNDNHTGSVTVNAQYVIVATSPLAAAPANHGGTINYTPALEDGAAQLFSSMEATPTVSRQILVVYKNRWWKKQGGGMFIMPPYATHVNEMGVWGNVVDGSTKDESKAGIVRIFVDSRRLEGMSPEQVEQSTIDFLKHLFPKQHDLVEGYEEIIFHDWNTAKPTIPGVTFTYAPTTNGVLSKNGKYFTQPYGRIHWGGSERSVWGANWMEGAVERGNDVSEELMKMAGWVGSDYNVRNNAATLRVAKRAMPVAGAFAVATSAEEDDLEAEPELEPIKLLPTPTSPLGLAESLQPDDGDKLDLHELYTRVGQVEKPRLLQESDVWISPQMCLDALRELEEAKMLKKKRAAKAQAQAEAEAEDKAEVSFSSSSSSSSSSSVPRTATSSSPLLAGVTPRPAHLPEGTTPFSSSNVEKPTVQQLQAVPALRGELPAFLLGLTAGVFITMAAFRFTKGSSQ